jgi:hypothetical protein
VARKQVLAALRDPAVGHMNFGVGRVFIIAYDYERVAKAIESGVINVHVDSRLAAHMAEYWSGRGPTALDKANSFAVPSGGSSPALLIHEATHAIFDMQNRASYTAESEAVAYVAQALFSRLKYGPSARYIVSSDPVHVVSWIAWQAIFDQASMLAEILMKVKPPYATEDQAKFLYWAISYTVTYINQGSNTSYDVQELNPSATLLALRRGAHRTSVRMFQIQRHRDCGAGADHGLRDGARAARHAGRPEDPAAVRNNVKAP